MKKVFNSKTFWIVSVVALAAIFMLSVNIDRAYKSTTKLLIIPRSPVSVKNADQIIGNLTQIPYSLSFYDRMAKENADVTDATVAELPDYKRQAHWNSALQTQRVGTSGVLEITVTDKDHYQAEVLSSQASKTLLGVVGLYYNIETDLDVRIINPTVTDYSAGETDYVLLLERLLGAFLLIYFIFFVSLNLNLNLLEKEVAKKIALPNFFARYGNSFSPAKAKDDEAVAIPEKKWTLPPEEKPYTDFIKTNKVASAPFNLPIAEDESFLTTREEEIILETTKSVTLESEADEEEKTVEDYAVEPAETPANNIAEIEPATPVVSEEAVPITREATPEEVKARLNKLLSGKL